MKSFLYFGVLLWNSSMKELKQCLNMSHFKKMYKDMILRGTLAKRVVVIEWCDLMSLHLFRLLFLIHQQQIRRTCCFNVCQRIT